MPRIRAESIAEHKSLTRGQVLDAAAALFRAQGYAETSLGDIAGYVGIGRTTLYEYFTDKEDLLATLVEDRIPAVIDDLIAVPQGLSNRDQLAELLIRSLDFISDDHEAGTLLMQETPRLSPGAQARIHASHRRLEEQITDLCAQGIESGEFRGFDPVETGQLVFAVMWSAGRTLLREVDAKQRRHEIAETVVRFIFDGLASR